LHVSRACTGNPPAGALPRHVAGKRDRAPLALGFAGAFRRSELCALEVADLTETPDGLRVTIRPSKTDQEGQGAEVAILRGYRLRPVEAVQTWLAAAEISSGPVFRAVALGGKVSDAPLADNSAGRIVKRYARRVGWPQPALRLPDQCGGEWGEHLEAQRGLASQEPGPGHLRSAARALSGDDTGHGEGRVTGRYEAASFFARRGKEAAAIIGQASTARR
jgi:integrase